MKDYCGVITEDKNWIDEKDASYLTGMCLETHRKCKICGGFHLAILDECSGSRICPRHGKNIGDPVCAGVNCNAKSNNCPTNKEKSK